MRTVRIYLDDVRTPRSPNNEWIVGIEEWTVVRSYDEFVEKVKEVGLENIEVITLDHDLGDTAMKEYFENVSPNYTLDYNNIHEKTGYDCAKWLVEYCTENGLPMPTYLIHSANPVGADNIRAILKRYTELHSFS